MKPIFLLKVILLALINLSAFFFAWFFVAIGLLRLMIANPCGNFDRLPYWLAWFDTPDQLLPGDLIGEPAVKKWYDDYGWFYCAWRWLSFRNVFFGFNWMFGKPCSGYIKSMSEEQKKADGIFYYEYPFWKLKLIVGYATYFDVHSWCTDKGFWAVPKISLRRRDQD